MSGIYISGLNMPDRYSQIVIHADGSVSVFDDDANCFQETRAKAIHVQDHGDLIDRNAMIHDIEKAIAPSWYIKQRNADMVKFLSLEDAIIPADHFRDVTKMVEEDT